MPATIAHSSTPNASPPSQISLIDGGITLALLGFILKEAIAFFKKKDDAEGELTQSLISDLRKERRDDLASMSQVLLKIDSSQQQIAIAIQEMSKALHELNLSTQQNARIHSEIFGLLREQERVLYRIEAFIGDREVVAKS